jgi:hypothetical protein
VVVLLATVANGAPARQAEPKRHRGGKVVGVVVESAKTGGRAARDGVLTFARATRDFFTKGPHAARRTWEENAAHTKATAKASAREVKREAKE